MSFVEPLLLLGLLAASLPIIVHLINRQKAVRVDFPALAFLLRSNRREARGIKVRQRLLMALRVLVIAFLAFSIAKPFVLSSTGVTASERLPTATVFVVDTSYSMGNGDWWANAQSEFTKRYKRLRPWDEVAIVTTAPGAPRPIARLTGNHGSVEDAFEALKPGEHGTHLIDALLAAGEILNPSELPNRRIVVLSDLSEGGFPLQLAPDKPLEYPVEFAKLRSDEVPANLSIEAVDYEQEGSTRDPVWRIEATVQNRSDERQKVEIRLEIDGMDIAGGLVDLEPLKSAKHTFRHKIEGTGIKEGLVRLVDADQLEADNRRYFVIRLRDSIRTLLVNGEASSIPFHDEMFFLERALNPRLNTNSNVVPELTTREGLESIELKDYDVVVLANVTKVTPNTGRKLTEFVSGGGGLLIAMGDQIDVPAYNATLAKLLPKPLRGMKQLALRDDPDAPIKITHFSPPRRQHPVFRVFQMPGGSSLQQVSVYSYMLLEPSPPEQSQLVLTYEDNAPALLERTVDRGRVLLLTTTVDDEWTDIPFQPAFLPLMRRAVQYLARRATSAGATRHAVGEKTRIEVSAFVRKRAIVTGPDDVRLALEPVDGAIEFTPLSSGMYTLWADDSDDPSNRLDALAFAANVDTEESNLGPLREESLQRWVGDANDQAESQAAAKVAEKRVNLWPFFLFLVTLFLLVETVLSTRRSVLSRLVRIALRRPEPDIDEL